MNNIAKENASVENIKTMSPIKICGDLLKTFIEQSKIVRDFTFSEMYDISKKLLDCRNQLLHFKSVDKISYGSYQAALDIINKTNKYATLFRNVPYELVVQICSLYDTFLSGLIKQVLLNKSLIGLFEKNLTLKEINKFENKEELFNYCIDCKVEEIFRKSHQEQIDWLEKSFNIKIKNSFKNWKQLILFFEMRNIAVHNNGVVNRIFLENLNKAGIANDYKIGDELALGRKFFQESLNELFVFAIYVFSLSLGKLYNSNEKRAEIDGYIIHASYEFLLEKEYTVTISIVDHCLQKNQIHSNSDQLYLTINKCIALKHLKKEGYKQIVEKVDWSNCNDLFMLAKHILIDDYPQAVKYMKKLADDEKMAMKYIKWPLFDWFRETTEFHVAFKEIYGIEFEEKLSQIAEEKAATFKRSSEENSDANEGANEKIAS